MDYIDSYGLVNSRADETNAENSMLWTLEYVLLLRQYGLPYESHLSNLKKAIDLCATDRKGIYIQNPSFAVIVPVIEHDNYMSPDQMIAIAGTSYLFGGNHHRLLWDEIKRQKWRYDNVSPDSPGRYMHPRDLALMGLLAGSKWMYVLLPFLCITIIISCMRPVENTSTKILSWIKFRLMEKSILMRLTSKICNILIVRKHGSWENVFKIYFPSKNHPIHKLVSDK